MPRKLICASPPPWHRLNPISRFIVSPSRVCQILSHTHTQSQTVRHMDLQAKIPHESRLITNNYWSFCASMCMSVCVCILWLLQSNEWNWIAVPQVELTQPNALSSQSHAHTEAIWDSKLKRLNHSNSLTTNTHNNTLWHTLLGMLHMHTTVWGNATVLMCGICYTRTHSKLPTNSRM